MYIDSPTLKSKTRSQNTVDTFDALQKALDASMPLFQIPIPIREPEFEACNCAEIRYTPAVFIVK